MYAIMAALFVTIFYFTFKNGQNERFLSISSEDMICNEVLRPFTGEYLIDELGNWEGSVDFSYTLAIYSIDFSDFKGSLESFRELMDGAFDSIESVGIVSKHLTLAGNVMLWIGYQGSAEVLGKRQILRFTGSSSAVFDSVHRSFGIGDAQGSCSLVPQTSYDRGANKFRIEYSATDYLSDETCTRILNPFHVKYQPLFDLDAFRIDISVFSIVTATALNLGIISSYELENVKGTLSEIEHNGVTYEYGSFYYRRFPGMDPIICVLRGDGDIACAVSIGNLLYGFPVFNHFGSNVTDPTPCSCPTSSDLQTAAYCNRFTFLPGLVFYEWNALASSNDSLTSLLNLMLDSATSVSKITDQAFFATNDAVNPANIHKKNSEWRENAYSFCDKYAVPNTRCSVSSFFVDKDEIYTISEYLYSLYNGACTDTFTVSKDIQNKIMDNPPTKLVEEYETCRNKDFEVFNNSVGVTAGNIATYFPILIMLFVIGQKLLFPSDVQTYSKDEKQAVVDFLALHMLLARDGLYYTSKEQSIIKRLTTELGSAAAVKRFHGKDGTERREQLQETQSSIELVSDSRQKSDIVKERLTFKNDYVENPLFVAKSGGDEISER